MNQIAGSSSDPTMRLTLRWVVAGMALLFVIGILGGLVGQWLFAPPLPPLSPNEERLVTSVQEVTISPNTATAQVVTTASRSVVLLATRVGTTVQPRGTAVVVTNDGLLATTATVPESGVVALDDNGEAIALDDVGRDELYGISYFRMPSSVMVPLDLRRDAVSVGTEFLALSRSEITRQIKVADYTVQEFILPGEGDSVALQRLWQGTPLASNLMIGSPLVDDEGHLAGLLLDTQGRSLSVETIELSLRRMAEGQREVNPLEQLGLALQFSFLPTTDAATVQFAPRIVAVTPGSPAASSGLLRGDILKTINDEEVAWERAVVSQLSAIMPLRLTVDRGGESHTVEITNVQPAL